MGVTVVEELIELVRELIVRLARLFGLGQDVTPSDRQQFAGYDWLTLEQRHEVIGRAREYNAALNKFSFEGSRVSLSEAFNLPTGISPLQPAGPANTSGVIISVPWKETRRDGKVVIRRVDVQGEWNDRASDIRRKAQEAINEIIKNCDSRIDILL